MDQSQPFRAINHNAGVVSLSPGFPLIDSPLFSLFESQGVFGDHGAAARQLHEQGYLLVDLGRERMTALAAQIRHDLLGIFDLEAWHANTSCGDLRVQDGWQQSASVRELALLPEITSLLRVFWGREPFAFQTLNFPVGTRQHFHSDAVHFHSEPAGFMCGVWVALEDIHPDAGPLEYYPGSHRLPFLQARDVNYFQTTGSIPDQTIFHDLWSAEIKAHGFERQLFTPRLGQALIWTANLLHGGAPVLDHSLTRWSQVTHYFFDGCQWYTPLLSDWPTGTVAWRRPVDVSTGLERPTLTTESESVPTTDQGFDLPALFASLQAHDLHQSQELLERLLQNYSYLTMAQWLPLRLQLEQFQLLQRLWPLLDILAHLPSHEKSEGSIEQLLKALEPLSSRNAVDAALYFGHGRYLVYGWSAASTPPELVARGCCGTWKLGVAGRSRLRRPDVSEALQLGAVEDSGFLIPFVLPPHESLQNLWLDGFRVAANPLSMEGFSYLSVVDDLLNRCNIQFTPVTRLPGLMADGLGDVLLHLRQTLQQQERWPQMIQSHSHFGSHAESAQLTVVVPLFGRWDVVLGQLAGFAADSSFVEGQARILYVVDDPGIASEFLGWCESQLSEDLLSVDVLTLNQNVGFSQACNLGVSQAATDRICLLNSDVFTLDLGSLEPLHRCLDTQPNALLAPLLLYETGQIQHAGMTVHWSSTMQPFAKCIHPLKGLDPG